MVLATCDKKSAVIRFICVICVPMVLSVFFSACSAHYSSEIEDVLLLAGKNRSELEKVLKHYSRNPEDSLKLRAAEFLIVNMPGKYSKYYDAPWNDVATVTRRWTSSSDKQMVVDTYGLGKHVVRKDVECITADYLTDNIDLAFKVWREQPWGKYIPFDTFCEEILPYRVGTEPLEKWREKALASFADLNRSFQEQPNITAVEACSKLNVLLPVFSVDKDFPSMSFSQMMASAKGTCDKMAALTAFAMRALGIPVTLESTHKWYNRNIGHTWNTVCDSAGHHIPFMGTETGPGAPLGTEFLSSTKVFRKTFARQEVNTANLPAELQNSFQKDVSSEYAEYAEIEIPVRFSSGHSSEDVCLAAWGVGRWNLIGWGQADKKKIKYSVNMNVLYMPIFYSNKNKTPINYPFMLNDNDEIRIFEPDTSHYCSVRLSDISPSNYVYLMSGVFEGANRSNFSDAFLLHSVRDSLGNYYQSVKIHKTEKFRYVRYMAKESYCNVAELRFYDQNGTELKGTPTGTPDKWSNTPFGNAFDGNPLTFFCSDYSNAWAGLDLETPATIGEIQFLPRTEKGFGIYDQQVYELLMWNCQEWQSLEKQTASVSPLTFRHVPANALLHVKNVTTDKTGQCFFCERDGNPQTIVKWNSR
ncbi:MAG: hypothetical protein LBN11_02755 [Tannerella sp.]|jgi:hypothetical protein|nr:hypothetical protein [Tannerella sp.]